MNKWDKNDICSMITTSHNIYRQFDWLLNAYVLDFYTENHWLKLPRSWKEYLETIDPEDMSNVLNLTEDMHCNTVIPLSLLTLRVIVENYHVKRKPKTVEVNKASDVDVNNFLKEIETGKLFWKHVKQKKKHEIERMAECCYQVALSTNCFNVIDIGSGLGHLSRLLSFGYGLKVCAIDVQHQLINQARKLDEEFEKNLKNNSIFTENKRPFHINMKIEQVSDISKILKIIGTKEVFSADSKNNVKFGIVGLHPCGDLGVTLLRMFSDYPQVCFINIVSCCYMKLTTTDNNLPVCKVGFPLSNYCLKNDYSLSYYSREIACHALEMYTNRLKEGQYWQLKIHSYRATIEKLITDKCPYLKHSPLGNVKYTENLTFEEYCTKALSKLNIRLNISENKEEIEKDLSQWKNVVMFYSLRLLLAPLIESIILLDRLLYILEHDACATLVPLFDPLLSPRNCVLSAYKKIAKENCPISM